MGYLKKYSPHLTVAAVIIILFFFTRLYHILSLPIFTDEAIYVRWAQIAKQDASWRFISLTDGKQPSFVWIAMVLMKFFEDPLMAGRMVSVLAGLFTTIGVFFLGRELFKNIWIGLLSSLLYVLFPMAVVYDRMALYDSLVTTFTIWALYFEVLLVKNLRLDLALILGMIIGGGVLTKTNAFFNIYLLPSMLLLFNWKKKLLRKNLITFIGFCVVATVIGYAMYTILRLSPFFHIIAEKTAIFAYPVHEWVKHPFTYFVSNFSALLNWFVIYTTIPIIILVAGSFIIQKKWLREKILIAIWFAVPMAALAFFGNTIYPRFIFFMIVPLLTLAAFSLYYLFVKVNNKLAILLILIVSLGWFIYADYFIVADFAHAPIPSSDVNQFNNDWPAGGGVREAVTFFKKEAEKGPIYIGTEGTFGLMPFSLEIYLVNNPNVTIKGFYPVKEVPPKDIISMAHKKPTYVVFYQDCRPLCEFKGVAPKSWPLKQVLQVEKPAEKVYFTVYRVKPE